MCDHNAAVLTIAHVVEQAFNSAGEVVTERLLPDPQKRIYWTCSACGATGAGSTSGQDTPAWVTTRLPSLPIVR
jgi:hypothetical protein